MVIDYPEIGIRDERYIIPDEAVSNNEPEIYDRFLEIKDRINRSRVSVKYMDMYQPQINVLEKRLILLSIRRTLWTAIFAMVFSTVIGIFGASILVLFYRTDFIAIHPMYGFFSLFIAVCLLVLSITSAIYCKRYTEMIIARLVQWVSSEHS